MAELTFYPDADPETISVDGYAWGTGPTPEGTTWAELHDGAGSNYSDSGTTGNILIWCGTTTDYWFRLSRGIFLFDTSSLSGKKITSAIFSIYGAYKVDQLDIAPNINIYSVSPASNDALVAEDYSSLGTTAYCDTAITYANWDASGYNNFTLNSTGLAAISKTGITKIGLRNANYDVANIVPSTWLSYKSAELRFYCAEKGESTKPKLTVTYLGPTEWEEHSMTALRLLSFDCRGVWYPERRNIIQCTILCDDGLVTRDGTIDGQTAADIKAAIEEARDDATWPVTFYDINGNTIYVKFLSARYRIAEATKDRPKAYVFDLTLLKVPLS